MAVTGIFAPLLSPHDPHAINERAILCPPFACEQDGQSYVLGTDRLGRDVLSRIVASFRTNLYIGLLGTLAGFMTAGLLVIARSIRSASPAPGTPGPLFGVPLWGLAISTYYIAFLPSLIVTAAMGTSLVMAIVCAAVFAALLPMVLLYDSVWKDDAASDTITSPGPHLIDETVRGDGLSSGPVQLAMRRGIALSPIGFSLAFLMGLFIEFYLTFLGVGVPPDIPSLGGMVSNARAQIVTWWWMVVFPFTVGLVAAGAFSGIVFPVSRVLSSPASATRPDALGITPAGFGIRFAAHLIDSAVILLFCIPFAFALAFTSGIAQSVLTVALIAVFVVGWVFSPGKRAVGLRVLRLDGAAAGWGRKFFRYLISLSTLFIIDLLMIALRKDRRTLHDLICGTIVVRRRDMERPFISDTGAEG